MRDINRFAVLLPVMLLLCLTGCGSDGPKRPVGPTGIGPIGPGPSGPTGPNVSNPCSPPIIAPQKFEVAGKDGILEIRFSKASPYQGVEAKYGLWYGTVNNFNSAKSLGTNVLHRSQGSSGDPSGPVFGEIVGLTNGVTYYVWVNAVWEDLCESSQSYHMETGVPVPYPSVPTGATAAAGEKSINVKWNLVDYALSYELAYHTQNDINDPAVVIEPNITDPQHVINGLTNNTQYYIWVRAYNNNGYSAYSEAITAVPVPASDLPDPVGPLAVEYGAKRIMVSWDPAPGAAYYELYWSDGASVSTLAAGKCESDPQCKIVEPSVGRISASITSLTNNTKYSVWVIAANSAGFSVSSPVIEEAVPRPKSEERPINFGDSYFELGTATAEYIFGEVLPATPIVPESRGGLYQDNLHRSKETPIGNLVADSVMWYLNERLDPGKNVDFVFLNSAFISGSLASPGPVTVGSLRTATSTTDEIMIIEMRGSDIRALFDFAADKAPHMGFRGNSNGVSAGHWPIVSKEVNYTLVYKYLDKNIMQMVLDRADMDPYYFGQIKAGTLKLNGAAFENNRIYRVATTDWVSEADVDGFYAVPMFKAINKTYTGVKCWNAVAEYIYDFGSITPAIDGRIQIEGGVPGGPFGVAEGYNRYCPAGSTYDALKGCIFP